MKPTPAPAKTKIAEALPGVLLADQARWVDDPSDVAVWEKSRRVGASWCTASMAVLTAGAQEGQDALYIGYSEDMTREFIDDCAMWAKAFNQVAGDVNEFLFEETDQEGEIKSIKAFRIDFGSGFKVLALSSRPRSIRGKQGLVIIDEAAFHDDLPGLLKAALALLIWGGKVRILSSHNGADNPFNQLVDEIRSGRKPYALLRTTFDDALKQGLYKRICLRTGKPWTQEGEDKWRADLLKRYGATADEELFCIPREGSGAWLSRPLIRACMSDTIPVVRWAPPRQDFVMWSESMRQAEVATWCRNELQPLLLKADDTLQHVMGGDFGRVANLTVFSPGCIQKDLKLRQLFQVELFNMPFEQQKQVALFILERLPRLRAAKLDARGNGHYLAEVCTQKFGSRVEGVMASETWYRENAPPMKADFEDQAILVAKDADTEDDLRSFELVKGVPRMRDVEQQAADQAGLRRHGDAGIAILMMHAASRSDAVPIEFESTGISRASTRMDDYAQIGG